MLIDGHALEVVRSHKVLGLVIQNDLKCNERIESVVFKASKRLYIILPHGGVSMEDLLSTYIYCLKAAFQLSVFYTYVHARKSLNSFK